MGMKRTVGMLAAATASAALGIWWMFAAEGALTALVASPLLVASACFLCVRGLWPGLAVSRGGRILLFGCSYLAAAVLPMALLAAGLLPDNETSGVLALLVLVLAGVPAILIMAIGAVWRVLD